MLLFLCFGCKQEPVVTQSYSKISGLTMGTYYKISYNAHGLEKLVSKDSIELILSQLNDGLSTYQKDALISLFNKNGDVALDTMKISHLHFYKVFQRARYFYEKSNGDFDPSVMPLVNFYGFGYTEKKKLKQLDSMVVRDMLSFVSMDLIKEYSVDDKIFISKSNNETELDMSAIAKGYAVDVISEYLYNLGIKDHLVDIGGEIVVKGKNDKNANWKLAISRPVENSSFNEADLVIQLTNQALASSGNYRNFYESNGNKYSHTINPKTGFPERSNLLGASVIARTCMDADAVATSCMVMGLEDSKAFIESLSNVEGCLIYNEDDSLSVHYSSGFSQHLSLNK